MIQGENWKVHIGNNLDILPTLEDNSIDSIVTDPPYELGFMGKKWDSSGIAYNTDLWKECLRVLKPGGHLLAFSGSRTYHRMVVAIEDAGFEIRDMIAWISNKTFPKSLDISKAIDKAAGAEREVIGTQTLSGNAAQTTKEKGGTFASNTNSVGVRPISVNITAPSTPEAQQWEGWGTALKPTVEPIVMARKPLIGTVAENVLTYGTGGLNIDGSRITHDDSVNLNSVQKQHATNPIQFGGAKSGDVIAMYKPEGRWPANVILDEYTAEMFEESRFFYVARASKRDRNEGLEKMPNLHPTVKPTALMRYLVKLVTPPNGTVLDPFTGSGSTGKAAILEGFQFIGIELTEDYIPIIEGRLSHAEKQQEPEGLF